MNHCFWNCCKDYNHILYEKQQNHKKTRINDKSNKREDRLENKMNGGDVDTQDVKGDEVKELTASERKIISIKWLIGFFGAAYSIGGIIVYTVNRILRNSYLRQHPDNNNKK